MRLLGAVEPDGLCVVDHERKDGHGGGAGGDGHVAGFEAGYVGLDLVDGSAGVGEGGLDDGVVL